MVLQKLQYFQFLIKFHSMKLMIQDNNVPHTTYRSCSKIPTWIHKRGKQGIAKYNHYLHSGRKT